MKLRLPEPVRMEEAAAPQGRLWQRIGWLILIWLASVIALGLVAYGFRWMMWLAGLSL